MDNILDHVVVQGQRYDIVSPTAFGDYIETIGSACINPDGYAQGSTFLARLGNEQFYYEATAAITQGSSILEGTNCKRTTVTGREAELASEIETLGDNVTSLSEALTTKAVPLEKTVQLSAGSSAQTFTSQTGVTANMKVMNYSIQYPSYISGNITVNTSANQISVQANVTAATQLTLWFEEPRTS